MKEDKIKSYLLSDDEKIVNVFSITWIKQKKNDENETSIIILSNKRLYYVDQSNRGIFVHKKSTFFVQLSAIYAASKSIERKIGFAYLSILMLISSFLFFVFQPISQISFSSNMTDLIIGVLIAIVSIACVIVYLSKVSKLITVFFANDKRRIPCNNMPNDKFDECFSAIAQNNNT